MDTLISGKKGSGKTFYAVDYIYNLPPEDQAKVLHNIDALQLGRTFDDYCQANGLDFYDLFTEAFHESNPELHGYIFIIDEVQKKFPKNHKRQENFQYFQMSRHYNIDHILITQDVKEVAYSVSCHSEVVLRAVPDIANPDPLHFHYREMSGSEQVDTVKVRKNKKIYELYKSADYKAGGKERKRKKPMQRILFGSLVLSLCLVFFGYKFFTSFGGEEKATSHDVTENNISYQQPRSYRSAYHDSLSAYPPSLKSLFGGCLTKLSTFSDNRDLYVVLLGVPYRLSEFPYKVITTKTGFFAVVPEDVMQAIESQADPVMAQSREGDERASTFKGSRG